MTAVDFYNKLDTADRRMLRNRFLDGKTEESLDTMDYLHMKNMADIVYPGMGICGNDISKDQEQIYELHNPNEEWQ